MEESRNSLCSGFCNLSDGEHSLLDISDRSGLKFEALKRAADALLQHGLLKVLEETKEKRRF